MSKKLGRPPHLSKNISQEIERRYLKSLEVGGRLPAEQTMAEELNVSRGTIRSSLRYLEESKRINRSRSRGSSKSGWTYQRFRLDLFQVLIGDYKPHYRYPLNDPHWQAVLNGIFNAFYGLRTDYMLSFQDLKLMAYHGERCENHFIQGNIKGLIFLGGQPESVYKSAVLINKPALVVDEDARAHGMDSICYADEEAGELLATKLLRLGHKRCVHVAESPERPAHLLDTAWQKRCERFCKVFEAGAGSKPQMVYLESRSTLFEQSSEAVLKLLRLPDHLRPTALILPVLSDADRWTTLAQNAGLAVPRDLTLMGFGSALAKSAMTGICFDSMQLGNAAGRLMRQQLLGAAAKPTAKPNKTGSIFLFKGLYAAGATHAHAPE
jgi:DNA-binding LacI/PurR family transcriptional regulator